MAPSTARMNRTAASEDDLEKLSALIDGECGSGDAAAFARRWRSDGELQACWDTYQLIGDTLRSEDLCRPGGRDPFMAGLRERLAQEPVVLAPTALPPSRRLIARRWMRPVSAAAGVMAVAGSVWLLPVRQGAPTSAAYVATERAAPSLAAAPAAARQERTVGSWAPYLAAHQQFPSGAAVVPTSGYLRPADHDSSEH